MGLAVSSEATDPADRLAEIKTQCEFGPLIGRTDALYLIAEVERLRAAESILQKLAPDLVEIDEEGEYWVGDLLAGNYLTSTEIEALAAACSY